MAVAISGAGEGTMASEDTYDVVVIGAGPGGYAAAIRASQNGLKTALVEKESRLGGTCLLRGCIPTKALLEAARRLDEARHSAEFGVVLPGSEALSVDLEKVVHRKERLISRLSTGIMGLCKKARVDMVFGRASFESANAIRVEMTEGTERVLQAKNVILATGSCVRELPKFQSDGCHLLNSDSALCLTRVPKRLLVVGSGAVGLEFASAFCALGSRVWVVESMNRLLPLADEDVSLEIARAFRRRKIGLYTSCILESVRVEGDVVHCCIQEAKKDALSQELEVDAVLVAVGRRANVDGLKLENAGLKLSEFGWIPVSSIGETDVPGIYAIGDLVNSPALAHVATKEGIIAADAISGRAPASLNRKSIPSAVYSTPEAAFVGLSEQDALREFGEVVVGKFPFVAIGRAVVSGETEGFVKLIADKKSARIVGGHLVGPHATELLGEIVAAIDSGATFKDVCERIHAHPTLSEAIGEAASAGLESTLEC